ncbi:hypothetical protein Lser_V15G18292 [Lactuca serriola]
MAKPKVNLPSFSSIERNASISKMLYGYASLENQMQRLPVFKYITSILYLVETHSTTIIIGETGSGKTTQIPHVPHPFFFCFYLKEAGWADNGRIIACTQPRRLAVQSVAAILPEEMGVKLGEEVGYTIRFEDITNSELTRIKFLTDGVLLREMMDDPLLSKYIVIMVDEAHERSLSTDILLGLLKKKRCWKRRPQLEGDDNGLQTEPAILSVDGRGFNVQFFYIEEPDSDYLQATVSTVMLIHDKDPMGDILVFLTGQDDIDTAVQNGIYNDIMIYA